MPTSLRPVRPLRWGALTVAALALASGLPGSAAAAIGDISTVSGTGTPGTSPTGPALGAQLTNPVTARATPDGGYLIVEETGNRVRKVSAAGQITTIAGTGTAGFGGDGGAATAANLDTPHGAIQLADGSILIADSQNYRIRKVSSGGTISTVAGNGSVGTSGNGGVATSAAINYPYDFALTPDGGYLFVEAGGSVVRKVSTTTATGTITAFAGGDFAGFSGDGGQATLARLNAATGIAAIPSGGYLIADNGNDRVRKVATNGVISTVAGGGAANPGTGGPATAAQLTEAVRVEIMPDGGYVIAEGLGHRVRRVSPAGTISTITGTGIAGFSGDDAPAAAAQVNRPIGVGVASDGDVLVADYVSHRIRRIDLADAPVPTPTPYSTPTPPPTLAPPTGTPGPVIPPALTPTATSTLGPPAVKVIQGATAPTATAPSKVIVESIPDPQSTVVAWDLNGDKKADTQCPADEPYFSFESPGGGSIDLGVAGGIDDGSALSAWGDAGTYELSASKRSKGTYNLAAMARCASNPDTLRDLTATLKVEPCKQQSAVFALIIATGCMWHEPQGMHINPDIRSLFLRFMNERGIPDSGFNGIPGFRLNQRLKFSGMTLDPINGSSIIVIPAYERILAANATLKVAGMTLKTGPIDLDLNTNGATRFLPGFLPKPYLSKALFSVNATGVPNIGGFARTGQTQVTLQEQQGARIALVTVQLRIPDIFSSFGTRPPAGPATFVSSQTGTKFEGLAVRATYASLGPVRFRDILFRYFPNGSSLYGCGSRAWLGEATAYLADPVGSGKGLLLAPSPRYPKNGIAFCDGQFREAGAIIDFANTTPRPMPFPGVKLENIGFGIGLNPPLLRGGLSMTVGDFTRVTGDMLIVAASGSQPYNLTANDGRGFGVFGPQRLTSPTIAVAGGARMNVPLFGELATGEGYFLYSLPDYAKVGGRMSFAILGGVASLNGWVAGEMSTITKKFNFAGGVNGCITSKWFDICAGLEGHVSSRGMTLCYGNTQKGGWIPGISYGWGKPLPIIWFPGVSGGCKPSTYWVKNVRGARALAARSSNRATRASAARQGGAVSFTVAEGEELKSVRIEGEGDSPSVEVRGPGGEVVSTLNAGLVNGATIGIARFGEDKSTIVGVSNGRAGTYSVTPLAGSPAIKGLQATRAGDQGPEASVKKDGDRRVLSYDVGSGQAGKSITFIERGSGSDITIGTVKQGKGTLKYTPALGPAGQREVVALTDIAGSPAPDVIVAKYKVSSTLNAGKPGPAKAVRKGKGLKVSWGKASLAEGYGVRVVATDGAETFAEAGKGARSVTVPGIAAEFGGKVTITARGAGGAYGPGVSASYGATTKPFSVIVPFTKGKKK